MSHLGVMRGGAMTGGARGDTVRGVRRGVMRGVRGGTATGVRRGGGAIAPGGTGRCRHPGRRLSLLVAPEMNVTAMPDAMGVPIAATTDMRTDETGAATMIDLETAITTRAFHLLAAQKQIGNHTLPARLLVTHHLRANRQQLSPTSTRNEQLV